MSPVAESIALNNGDLAAAANQLLNFPETLEKFGYSSRTHHGRHEHDEGGKGVGSILVDILETPKDYIFYMDVPGLAKSDIQVTIEDEKTLVVRSSGKRKHEDGAEEGCKYIRLERRPPRKMLRKFRLPEDAKTSAITAKCENGVLTLVVEKNPPPKPKTVQVAVA